MLELKNTINTMVDQLNSSDPEVTRVAKEVGTEGQARRTSPGRRHIAVVARPHRQRDQLAANLTNQVRAIAEVATAVTGRPHPLDYGRSPW